MDAQKEVVASMMVRSLRAGISQPQIPEVGESRDADERKGARLRGHDGEHDRPPGDLAARHEVVARGATAASQVDAQPGHTDEINEQDDRIERGEMSGHAHTSHAALRDDIRLHREVLREPEPVEQGGRLQIAGLDALPEFAFIVAGEGSRVLLRLMFEDCLDLQT